MNVTIVAEGERGEGYSVIAVCTTRQRARDFAAAQAITKGFVETDEGNEWEDKFGVDYITIEDFELVEE